MDSYASLDDLSYHHSSNGGPDQSVQHLCVEFATASNTDKSGIMLRTEQQSCSNPLSEAVISGGSGGVEWKNSDLSRALSLGVVVRDAPPPFDSTACDLQCTRIVSKTTTWKIGGENVVRCATKRHGYMWNAPQSQLEAHLFLQYIHEFMADRLHENDTRTLHVLVERMDTSGMTSDGTYFADANNERMQSAMKPSRPAAVLVNVCTNDTTTQATCTMRSSSPHRTLVCESCFLNTNDNFRGAEGRWLAIGVSSTTNVVPRMLCGTEPSLWLGQRVRVNRAIRLDFPDRFSLKIPDLFQWKTNSCSMSLHSQHAGAAPDAEICLVASPFPQLPHMTFYGSDDEDRACCPSSY